MTGRVASPLAGACLALACAGALSVHGRSVIDVCPSAPATNFRTLSRSEVEALVRDVAATNPKAVERLQEDPELKQAQLKNLRELLAFASQAIKDGLADNAVNCSELSNIQDETVAVAYDKHLNKAKPAKGPFGYITAARVSSFWGKTHISTISNSVRDEREAKFQQFLETKKMLLARDNPGTADRGLSDEEITAARDFYAKTQIYAAEYAQRSTALPTSIRDKITLLAKLQQAQFLARLYVDAAAEKMVATDEEVAAYLAEHKELSGDSKRATAERVLLRAKAGEDFAKLANEFTEDPGNKGADGEPHGGSYLDVSRGTMVKPFESAALSLEAGQIYPALVESDFGFHIIKLDRKDPGESGTYDVRHILLSTTVPDPDNPGGRELPVKTYVRARIEDEKQERLLGEIVRTNAISVPSDFSLPTSAPKLAVKKITAAPKRVVRKRR